MAYVKQTWADGEPGGTPLDAARLNYIENGIQAAAAVADAAQPSDPDLSAFAALDSSVTGVLATDGGGWIRKTYAQIKTALGLVKADVGLGSVDNTSDMNKPVSTATQTALDLKAPLASPALTGNPTAPTQTAGNNSTRLATTAYTDTAIATRHTADNGSYIAFIADATGVAATDTAAIQAAHDALPSTGGRLMLGKGDYAVTVTSLTISKPCLIQGCGKGDITAAAPTRLIITSATGDGLTISGHGVTLADLAVVNTAASPSAGSGVRVTAGDGFAMTRVKIVGFYNNLQIEQARHYTITDCHFMDQVNYGAYLQNTAGGQADFGDCSFLGCFFAAYNTSRVAASAVRWESGGGLKMVGCKTNGNMATSGQSFQTAAIDIAVADGVTTSDFLFSACSLEGMTGVVGIRVGQKAGGSLTGQLSNIMVNGCEFSGGGISMSCNAGGQIKQVSVIGTVMVNVVVGANSGHGLYLKNVTDVTYKPAQFTGAGYPLATDAGCSDIAYEPGNMTPNLAPGLYTDVQTATTRGWALTGNPLYRRPITAMTSSYATIWHLGLAQYTGGLIELVVHGNMASAGGSFIKKQWTFVRTTSTVTLTAVGTDITQWPGANPVIDLQAIDSSGDILIQAKLDGTGGASGVGSCRSVLKVDGGVSQVAFS